MKKVIFLLLAICPLLLLAQKGRTYSVHVRAQTLDTTGYCNCPQDDNTQDYDGQPNCNSLGNVMVSVYADTVFLKSYYTDETGYCPIFNLPYGKYRFVITEPNHITAMVLLDFTATNKYRIVEPRKGTMLHYSDRGTTYFMCVMLYGHKKTGVKIVPKQ